jgi:hypothetical protein
MEKPSFKSLSILCDLFTILFNFLSIVFTPATKVQPSFQSLSAPKGKFYEPPPSKHPILTSGYELHPDLIALVQELSFFGLSSENPDHHLHEFEQLCSRFAFASMTRCP